MTIEEAKAVFDAARTELSKISSQEHAERVALNQKWYGPLSTAKQAVDDAKRALDLATAESAKMEHAAKIGARYVEWTNTWKPLYMAAETIPWKRTGRVGIVEVFGPDNKLRNGFYARPRIGELCIRVLLKSGKPGAEAIAYGVNGWFPEGVHPTEAPKPEPKEIEL